MTEASGTEGAWGKKERFPKTPTLPCPWPLRSLLGRGDPLEMLWPGTPPACPFFLPSLVSCEIDNQTAKPLTANFVLCPALEEIL